MSDVLMIHADARHIPLPDNSVQCVVTSPPYWGLRKYAGEQELVWDRPLCGYPAHPHEWGVKGQPRKIQPQQDTCGGVGLKGTRGTQDWSAGTGAELQCGSTCLNCGAWRGAYGLEPTIEMYVAHTVEILREVRRVLRPDGVCFWNIGDSYVNGTSTSRPASKNGAVGGWSGEANCINRNGKPVGLKTKDLCLIPARVAIAAQADGWWVRSMIIWAKPNPMPESVTDRPTDAYEHIIMLTKSERYYWDMEAVSEPCSENTHMRISQDVANQIGSDRVPGKTNGNMKAVVRGGINPKCKNEQSGDRTKEGFNERWRVKQNESFAAATCLPVLSRNLRNVWTFPTQPYKGAHFATFPEELPRRCIMAATKPGDLVLDPFGGSGTVGRVAIELNRSAFLLDIAYGSTYGPLATKRTTGVQRKLLA